MLKNQVRNPDEAFSAFAAMQNAREDVAPFGDCPHGGKYRSSYCDCWVCAQANPVKTDWARVRRVAWGIVAAAIAVAWMLALATALDRVRAQHVADAQARCAPFYMCNADDVTLRAPWCCPPA